ncbi:hypothetical protein GWK47_002407 [Chionoecetes opilio]|uniref:Uncharacterized protein n=1 Tax=Chionoecetes opilio TaxID=41210 RepID=A0A8J4XNX7_CHIOP|nr:hypothetical protein GWK47_002407 [Chionoecetes opilio]
MVMVVMVSVVAGTVLQCGVQCSCQEEKRQYDRDFRVICNASSLEEATLTEDLMTGASNYSHVSFPRGFVSVRGGPKLALTLTLAFVLRWRELAASSLDVSGAGRVIFPKDIPPFTPDKPLKHYYAGLVLTNVTYISEIPVNIFSGKKEAGLTLNTTTIGRLPPGLLNGTTFLHHLHLFHSTVGIMEGPLREPQIRTQTGKINERVIISNSTLGLLSSQALNLKLQLDQKVILQGSSIARMDSEALQVDGGTVEMEHCTVAKMEVTALVLGKDTRFTLQDNWFAVKPGALTSVLCDGVSQDMLRNHYYVLYNATTAEHISLTPQNNEHHKIQPQVTSLTSQDVTSENSNITERQRLQAILSTVLHPSCLSHDLIPPPTTPPPTIPTELWKLAVLACAGLIAGLLVSCITLLAYQRCQRRQRKQKLTSNNTTVLMSQLHEEPIYSEPSEPPALPPFPASLCRPSDTCASLYGNQDSCGDGTKGLGCLDAGERKGTENEYMMMIRK